MASSRCNGRPGAHCAAVRAAVYKLKCYVKDGYQSHSKQCLLGFSGLAWGRFRLLYCMFVAESSDYGLCQPAEGLEAANTYVHVTISHFRAQARNTGFQPVS